VLQTFNFSGLSKLAPTIVQEGDSKTDAKKVARKVFFSQVASLSETEILCVNSSRHHPGVASDAFEGIGVGAAVVVDAKEIRVSEWSPDLVGKFHLPDPAPPTPYPFRFT
jgi:hypothetical protein